MKLRRNNIVGNFSGEKRLNNLVYVEVNKVSDKELAPSTLGHQRPLEYRRVPHLGLPLAWILEAGASK